jgi:signal transduction histidine kinase
MKTPFSSTSLIALCLGLCLHAGAMAQEHGTRDEARQMVDAAVAHAKKVGPDQAFKDFADKSNTAWQKKDLYIFAYSMDGVSLAHGANEKLIGKKLIDIKDPNGKPLIQEMIKALQTDSGSKDGAWVDYEWPHPQSKKVESKASYVRRFANFDGFVGVGVYR